MRNEMIPVEARLWHCVVYFGKLSECLDILLTRRLRLKQTRHELSCSTHFRVWAEIYRKWPSITWHYSRGIYYPKNDIFPFTLFVQWTFFLYTRYSYFSPQQSNLICLPPGPPPKKKLGGIKIYTPLQQRVCFFIPR